MYKILFVIMILQGKIKPVGDCDGRELYCIPSEKIEYAYKPEIIHYLKTHTFEYNEDLK